MDFVADGLIGGRRLRCLTITDDCTRECLAIEVDTSITGLRVHGSLGHLTPSEYARNGQESEQRHGEILLQN
jgi:transposase InsO family protein